MRLILISESPPNVQFVSWMNTGDIKVLIDGIPYIYNIGAHRHPRLQALARKSPLKALNQIKKESDGATKVI